MFGLAERDNFHDNLMDSIKAVISSHKVFSVRAPLLTPFLSNGVESSILTSFFNADLINRISDGFPIALINVNDNAENRIIFSYYYKNCNHFINHLLSLMDLILKVNENIDMLYK